MAAHGIILTEHAVAELNRLTQSRAACDRHDLVHREALARERERELERADEPALAFNLSGHILHSIFWQNLAPKGGGRPNGELAAAIERDFGGFDQLKRQMVQAASTIMRSGLAALVWEPVGWRLLTTQIYDPQSNLSQGGIPLLVLDAWERAFYLQYQNRKAGCFEAVWSVWNWTDAAARFRAVKDMDVKLPGTSRH